MAPPTLYEEPEIQLVRLLAEYREMGLPFEEAWRRSVRPRSATVMTSTPNPPEGCVLWSTDSSKRIVGMEAIFATKDAYRRAYQRRPATRRERALPLLMAALDGVARVAPARGIPAGGALRSAA